MSEQVSEPAPARGRSTMVVAAVTTATLVVAAGAALAGMQFLNGGPRAETALPAADTLAVVSVDLDPSARQKVEALKTFERFPALKKELKLSSGDDLRKLFFDQVLDQGTCKGLSYATDVEPWIGDNAAFAAASFEKGKVSPLVALSITDEAKAKKGLAALLACDESKEASAFAFHDGFALITDTQAHANRAAKDAGVLALSDDPGYQEWTGRLGGRGVVNFYVAAAAADQLGTSLKELSPGLGGRGQMPSRYTAGVSAPYSRNGAVTITPLRKGLSRFKGAAGAVRFAGGGAELEVVSSRLGKSLDSGRAAGLVEGLPSDTSVLLGFAIPKGWASTFSDTLSSSGISLKAQLQDRLGLALPGDLESLLGRGLALSLRGTPPGGLSRLDSAEQLPAGLTILGDPAKIKAVIAKVEAKQGSTLAQNGITVAEGAGKVTLSFDKSYAKTLLGDGTLETKASFRQVVPDADKASVVGYVDFDSPWRSAIAKTLHPKEARSFLANTKPLKAFGFSGWTDAGVSHLLLKVTTD